MNAIKKILGLCWLILAPLLIIFLIKSAFQYIDPAGTREINNPVIWVIIILIFLPICIGLFIFGWYAFKGEYNKLPQSSAEI